MNHSSVDADQTHSVKVSIFDQTYSLRSESDVEHIRQIAQLVDERMRLISSHLTTYDIAKVAVLAALNIADEMQRLRDHYAGDAQAMLIQSSHHSEGAEPAPENEEAKRKEGDEPQSWFESIFDSQENTKDRSGRLSSQVSAKLQSLRRPDQQPLTIEVEEDGN